MIMTKRKPATVGEILNEEFLGPYGLTQDKLAKYTGLPRKHINELVNDRRAMTTPTAIILSKAFGNSPEFWLNIQRRIELWNTMHDPKEVARIEKVKAVA